MFYKFIYYSVCLYIYGMWSLDVGISYSTGCVFNSTWAFLSVIVAKYKFLFVYLITKNLQAYTSNICIYLFKIYTCSWNYSIFFLHPNGLSFAHPGVCAPHFGDHCYRFSWSCTLGKKNHLCMKFFLNIWARKLRLSRKLWFVV